MSEFGFDTQQRLSSQATLFDSDVNEAPGLDKVRVGMTSSGDMLQQSMAQLDEEPSLSSTSVSSSQAAALGSSTFSPSFASKPCLPFSPVFLSFQKFMCAQLFSLTFVNFRGRIQAKHQEEAKAEHQLRR